MRYFVSFLMTVIIAWCSDSSAIIAQGKWKYDFIVPTNGTFRQAIKAANERADKSKRYRIFVKSGHYRMHTNPDDIISTVIDGKKVEFPSPIITLTAPNTSIIGEGAGHTQIENCPKYEGISITSTLFLKGADSTYIQDLELWSNFRNDPNLFANRAVALNEKRCKGNVLKGVSLLSTQDTYYTNDGGTTYLEDCAIAGTVDFICGGGTVFFNRCELRLVPRGDSGKRDIIAAPATAIGSKYGYVFNDCQVRGPEMQNEKYILARPWKNGPKAVFINTVMHVTPDPLGWGEMHGMVPSLFAEYESMDKWFAPIDLSKRKREFQNKEGVMTSVSFIPELTDEDVEDYSVGKVFDGWEAEDVARQIIAPPLTLNGRNITWKDNEEAGCYAVYRDRRLVTFTTEPHYTIPKGTAEGACYYIRCANQRGGLGEPSEEIVYSRYRGL